MSALDPQIVLPGIAAVLLILQGVVVNANGWLYKVGHKAAPIIVGSGLAMQTYARFMGWL